LIVLEGWFDVEIKKVSYISVLEGYDTFCLWHHSYCRCNTLNQNECMEEAPAPKAKNPRNEKGINITIAII
jgi:hypothetical protein